MVRERCIINDCDHKCPKAVGFSYPGVVPHCSECESEKKKRKYDVKQECIDEVSSVEAMKEVEKKLWLEHYNQLCKNCRRLLERNVLVVKQTKPINLDMNFCLLASAEEHGTYVLKRPIVESIGMMSWNLFIRKYLRCPLT